MNREEIYIVREHPMLIQKLAKQHMSGEFWKYFMGFVIFYIFTNCIPNILAVAFDYNIFDYFNINLAGMNADMLKSMPAYSLPALMYLIVFNGVFQLGKALYVITFLRNKSSEYGALFEGFKLYGKALSIFVLQTIIISIWTFFFIIPGVIAAYGLRQSYYILADDPSKSPIVCMAESKLRMRGNKMSLFMLDLYYVFYLFLANLPAIIITSIFHMDAMASISNVLIYSVLQLPLVAALAFYNLGQAVYYELMISHGFANFRFAGEDIFRNAYNGMPR